VTFYLDVYPEWPHSKTVHETRVDASTPYDAIMQARGIPGVLMVTSVRNEPSRRSRPSWPRTTDKLGVRAASPRGRVA
jgi:hypothetical protein